jgi:hypothetical protein
LALVAVFAVVAVMSATASALQWLIGGRPVTAATAINSTGKLLLSDLRPKLGGQVAIECEGTDRGTVGPGAKDEVTTITAEKCKFQSGLNGACEASKEVTAKAVNLPWLTLLLDSSRSPSGIGDRVTADNGRNPGWSVECTVAGIFKITDTCESSTAEPDIINLATGVDARFLASETAGCSEGDATSGIVIGNDLNLNPAGGTLSVSASPNT